MQYSSLPTKTINLKSSTILLRIVLSEESNVLDFTEIRAF